MLCSDCGAEAVEGARYCSNCGRLLVRADDGSARTVAEGGEPGLSWAGRGPMGVGAPSAEPQPQPRELAELELATFGRRLGGFGVDLAAAAGLGVVLLMVASLIYVASTGIPEDDQFTDAQAEQAAIIWWALFIPTWLAMTWFFNAKGWTLGKRAVGLRIVDERGRAPGVGRGMGRTVGAWVSWIPLGLGFLWASWDERGQTWHDKMAGTYVVRVDTARAHHERGSGSGSLH